MSSNWLWQGAQAGSIIEFQIPRGGVALCLIRAPVAHNPAPPSRICLLGDDELQFKGWNEAFLRQELEKISPCDPQTFDLRIIGTDEKIQMVRSFFRKIGFEGGKDVELMPPLRPLQFLPESGRIRILRSAESSLALEKLKVLVVDDSETIRHLLTKVIAQDPLLTCVGTVGHPREVEAAIQKYAPDVLTLDIHMPEMNGVELLKMLAPKYRIPTVMISSLSTEEGTYVLDALESGALDYIQKPSLKDLATMAPIICEKIRNAGHAKNALVMNLSRRSRTAETVANHKIDISSLIVIGSSTGGTEALRVVLTSLPKEIPPILIVQHIPAIFSKAFADRMNKLCPFEVREAQHGDALRSGLVLVAPGGMQMKLQDVRGEMRIALEPGREAYRHNPSVDVLFESVADLKMKRVVGLILTGMGTDGAKGLLSLRKLGARTIAQDEATCIVYGMPKEAVKLGAVERVVPIEEVASAILSFCEKNPRRAS